MWSDAVDRRWMQLASAVFIGMREWRLAHPRATLTEIETAMDARWATVRAHLLEDLALASAATDATLRRPSERPVCAGCGQVLHAHGMEERTLTTMGDQPIRLCRTRAVCPTCGVAVFPPR
jgi:hypothetical protein